MTERPEPAPGLIRLDVRKYMDESGEFWDDVSAANLWLSAFPDDTEMTALDEAKEELIVQQFNEKYFGVPWIERNAHFTIAYDDGPENTEPQLGVDTRDGKFVACIVGTYEDNVMVDRNEALFVSAMARKALAFLIKTETEVFTFPVNKNILALSVDIPPPASSERTIVGKLYNCNEKFTNFLHSELFLESELGDQKLQIEDCLNYFGDISGISDFMNGKFEVVIDPGGSSATSKHIAGSHMWLVLPEAMEREEPFRSVGDFEYDELHLAIQQPDSDAVHFIPVSLVIDIVDLEAPARGNLHADILGRFFEHRTVRQTIASIEDRINSIKNQDECVMAIQDAIEELHELVPDNFYDLRFDIRGYVLRDEDEEGLIISETIEEYRGASFEDFEILPINGRFQIVLPFEVGDFEDKDSSPDMFYVVPDRSYISELRGYEPRKESYVKDDEAGIDLVREFSDCCNETQRLVRSKRFKKASRTQQCAMLERAIRPINNLIDSISPNNDNEIVECYTDAYWLANWGDGEVTCAQIARLPPIMPPTYSHEQSVVVRGDRIAVVIPETVDPTIKRFRGRSSFPLSHGNPMLLVEDSERQATYYIPLGAISRLIPGVRNEQSE